ncbi:MAG: DUF192 domain-containing protein [Geminicoccaceae bacterium]
MSDTIVNRWLTGLFALALAIFATIGAYAEDAGQTLAKSPLHIESRNQQFEFLVELAKTPEERRVGLMHRRELAPDQGMLFDFGRDAPVSMWMKNTYIPLDMIFIRADGEIVNIASDTVPHSAVILASEGPVRAVLEVPAGTSRLLGIKAGDRVKHPTLSAIAE